MAAPMSTDAVDVPAETIASAAPVLSAETPSAAAAVPAPEESRKRSRSPEPVDERPAKRARIEAPKRKVALFMGYSGTGYYGMQLNEGKATIEGELQRAFAESGAVAPANAPFFHKYGYTRAARTDRGVHAAGQVCGLKIHFTDGIVERINAALPPTIRVFGVTRVVGSFNAKNYCDHRRYEYLLPCFAVDVRNVHKLPAPPPGWKKVRTDEYTDIATLPAEYLAPDLPADVIARVRMLCAKYVGSRAFHNFTTGHKANESFVRRVIHSFTVSEPFVANGLQVLSLRVQGQSFMLHQIRRMVGLVVAAIRGGLSDEAATALFDRALSPEFVRVPEVPGNGLLLDRACFQGSYNKKHGAEHGELSFDPFEDSIAEFKAAHIYPQILANDVNAPLCMFSWLRGRMDRFGFRGIPELAATLPKSVAEEPEELDAAEPEADAEAGPAGDDQ